MMPKGEDGCSDHAELTLFPGKSYWPAGGGMGFTEVPLCPTLNDRLMEEVS